MKVPRIALFGDSHSHAVQRAIERRLKKTLPIPVKVYRLLKEKNGSTLGDTKFEDFIHLVKSFGSDDVVYSMIGGNAHAVTSTVQHPRSFDFNEPSSTELGVNRKVELIPYAALRCYFVDCINGGDGASLKALRNATQARVVHIMAPPPKRDNAHIEAHHESRFKQDGIAGLGVSSPELRMKFWRLQVDVLSKVCRDVGIDIMMPPIQACDEDGFLLPEYYARDATHANPSYGELLLKVIENGGPSLQSPGVGK